VCESADHLLPGVARSIPHSDCASKVIMDLIAKQLSREGKIKKNTLPLCLHILLRVFRNPH
jgi:hypothetical protein